jgi:hypothetical protein
VLSIPEKKPAPPSLVGCWPPHRYWLRPLFVIVAFL